MFIFPPRKSALCAPLWMLRQRMSGHAQRRSLSSARVLRVWRLRSRDYELSLTFNRTQRISTSKVRCRRMRQPARCKRALPRFGRYRAFWKNAFSKVG